MMSKPERNVALDLAKGSLVMLMVFYHCASMAMLTPEYQKFATVITQNINFISRAFLVMSGLLCGMHYLPKLRHHPEQTRIRLAVRSVKLLLIFLVLNLILYLLGIRLLYFLGVSFSIDELFTYFKSPYSILLFFCNIPADHVAFEIIYYIGIFLLVTCLILGRINIIFPLTLFFIINGGHVNIIWGLTYGFIGLLAGSLWENHNLKRFWELLENLKGLPVILLFLIYRLFFYELNSLFTTSVFFISTITYCFEIMLWLLSCVFILQILKMRKLNNIVILLGKYTLISYIMQMVIIRINYVIISKYLVTFHKYYIINIVISSIFLYIFVFTLDYVRKRYIWVNKGYEIIFN